MAIYARKKESDYAVAPEGLWPAVCCDVVDLGVLDSPFGPQVKIEIRWQLEEVDPKTGKRYMVVQRYTPSLHEKSRLRPLLESWRGKKFSKDEEREFDIEKLLGANCQLQIIHNVKDEGRVYANVQAAVPPPRNFQKLYAEDYVRMVERPDYKGPQQANGNGNGNGYESEQVSDDYVPF